MTLIFPQEDADGVAIRGMTISIDEDARWRTDWMEMDEINGGASAAASSDDLEGRELRGVGTRFQSRELK